MDVITSQIDSIRWLFSPGGIVAVLALTGLVMSGLPGALILKVEGLAPTRPSRDREKMSP